MKQEIINLINNIPTADTIAYYDLSINQMLGIIVVIVLLALIGWALTWGYVIKARMGD